MERFNKLEISLKYYLLGKGFHKALKALAIAEKYHTGFRKDGITPEFQHQIEIALHITTLKDVINEELCLVIALLHDVYEDYGFLENTLGVEKSLLLISKKSPTFHKSTEEYYSSMENDPFASLVKGADRCHNIKTMVGVFTKQKQIDYISETNNYVLPMLKNAALNHPEQHLAYMNIRTTLKTQIEIIEKMFDINE